MGIGNLGFSRFFFMVFVGFLGFKVYGLGILGQRILGGVVCKHVGKTRAVHSSSGSFLTIILHVYEYLKKEQKLE